MTGAGAFRLRRPPAPQRTIPLVPMIDVLMILLVFFMVTSTYLDLDIVPLRGGEGEDAASSADVQPGSQPPLLVRLDATGGLRVNGQSLTPEAFAAELEDRIARNPGLELLLLPSGSAGVQSLVSVMDLATGAGVTRLRLLRLETRP